jgi:hypothetical protein
VVGIGRCHRVVLKAHRGRHRAVRPVRTPVLAGCQVTAPCSEPDWLQHRALHGPLPRGLSFLHARLYCPSGTLGGAARGRDGRRFPHADRDRLAAIAQAAGTEIETLAGQSFGPAKQNSVAVNTCGLPFVELPALLIGSQECPTGMWPIPNPVDRQRATVVQVRPVPQPGPVPQPVTRATSVASALQAAGGLVHTAAQAGVLSRDFMLAWLGQFLPLTALRSCTNWRTPRTAFTSRWRREEVTGGGSRSPPASCGSRRPPTSSAWSSRCFRTRTRRCGHWSR